MTEGCGFHLQQIGKPYRNRAKPILTYIHVHSKALFTIWNEKSLKCKPLVLIFGRGRAKKSHIALQGSCNIGIHVLSIQNHVTCESSFVEQQKLALLRVREALTKRTR